MGIRGKEVWEEEYGNIKDLINVFKMPKQSVLEMYSPYFYTYFKGYFSKPDRLIRKLNEMKVFLSRINPQNAVLVDLGCGFGLESIMLSIITDNMKIIGIDHNEEKIRFARKLSEQSRVQNIDFILQGGESLSKGVKADIVFCRDVLSHVNDINTFFDSIIEILEPKGVLHIIDDRNPLNLSTVWKTRRLQRKAENGEIEIDKLREIDAPKNFFETRKGIILKNFRYMDGDKVNKWARMSAGLCGDQIVSFVESAERGERLKLPEFRYVNPITGESCERLHSPTRIRKLLKKRGLRATIEKPFFGCSRRDKGLRRILISLVESLHPVSLFISPVYHIKAVKT